MLTSGSRISGGGEGAMGAARAALLYLAAVCALFSPPAGGAGLLPACACTGGSVHCTRVRGAGVLLPLRLRGGGQWAASDDESGGFLEDGGLSKRPKKKGRADAEKVITFKPGQDMGTGSLRLVPKDKEPVSKLEPIEAGKDPVTSLTFGEPDQPPGEPSRFKKDWWTGCSRDDIMDYIRLRDEERTPDACTKRELNEDLVWAAEQGDLDKIKRLVAAGAEVNAGGAGGSSQWVALHHAARHQQTDAAIALLDLGARVNVHTWGKWTALHFACATHNLALVKLLFERGADVYAVNADEETPYDRSMNRCRDFLKEAGYSEERAEDLKKAVNHIAPQFPRDGDGEIHSMFQVAGEPDTYTARLMANIKPKVETVGDNTFWTYSDEEIDIGEPFWKDKLWVDRDDGKGELDRYMDSGSDVDSAEEDARVQALARKRVRDQARIEELSDSNGGDSEAGWAGF